MQVDTRPNHFVETNEMRYNSVLYDIMAEDTLYQNIFDSFEEPNA